MLPAGSSESLAVDPASGSVRLLADPLGPLLRGLSGFRSLEGHLAALREQGWQDDGNGYLASCLAELAARSC